MSEQCDQVVGYLMHLQDRICAALSHSDNDLSFHESGWTHPGGGQGRARLLRGDVFEQAGVNFSFVRGGALPAAATTARPELKGAGFQAAGVSIVVHPRNPYVPTTHCNVRYFETDGAQPVWWIGGGFDLTPYYGFDEDVLHWHRSAQQACADYDPGAYPRFKAWCDEYFHIPHRREQRGVGGIFFDDLHEGGFARNFAFLQSVGDRFCPAYLPIVDRRKDQAYGERERDFQLYRRGRYVEFNLLYDRGTRFGLESGGRAEAILMSLPPEVRFRPDWQPAPGTPEALLYERYLKPRDWLSETLE